MDTLVTTRWKIAEAISETAQQELAAYPKVLQQLLFNRGVKTAEAAEVYLDGAGSRYDPFGLKNMADAVDRILSAIDNEESIVIYGDYDADGVTATALLTQVLRNLGANVRPYIPNRFEEGYGLNMQALDRLHDEGANLVITVDCGIRSLDEITHAYEIGLEMIVSDHHEPAAHLSDHAIVVCPKQEGDTYPEKNLAGVGVAFKIAEALVSQRPLVACHLDDVLDLVAVGTVADLVPLTGENRSLVQAGLETLRSGRRQGLFSLMQAAHVDVQHANAGSIGFGIGPRINAAGRLDQANPALDLLLSDDLLQSGLLAQQLDDLNQERKNITQWIQEEAEKQAKEDGDDFLLFAAHPDFKEGVVGLAASRLTESYYRPAVVGHYGEETTRASCRSISEFHITRALDECADLLVRHGGHAMAAGFTVRNEDLDELMGRLKAIARRELEGQELSPEFKADMELALHELHPQILHSIAQLEPTGQKNSSARFVSRSLRVTRRRQVGQDRRHLKLTVTDGQVVFDAIAFRQGHWYDQLPEFIDLLYSYETNEFNGRVTLQLNVKDIKPSVVEVD